MGGENDAVALLLNWAIPPCTLACSLLPRLCFVRKHDSEVADVLAIALGNVPGGQMLT